MKTNPTPPSKSADSVDTLSDPLPGPHRISDHPGILAVLPKDDGERVEIAFDPKQVSENELRQITQQHLQWSLESSPGGWQRRVLRLDGDACEAAASRLENRVRGVSGVRKATATYIGRVLCLTFDPTVTTESNVLEGVRDAGAKVSPLPTKAEARPTLWQRITSGDLNNEIACAIGLVTLLLGAFFDHVAKDPILAWCFFGASYFFGGQAGVRSAIASLREKTLDVDLLMVLAALGAAAVGSPLEGALLLFLFSFSNVLQRHALERTQRAIESLLTLRPDHALKKTAAGAETVPIDSLSPGDVVIIRPGELVPVDGLVTEGTSFLDESSLTGESLPVEKTLGAEVFAGTLNQSGALEVRVVKKSEDSTLAKMVRLVAEAQAEKSGTQRFLEKAEQGYAAGVILFTILVLLIPWLIWGEDFTSAFYRAMTVMVVASPCALIISTPATVLSAIGGAARRGILIKGGAHLETAARIDLVCFDKTGTLTVGKPSLRHILTEKTSALCEELADPIAKDCLRLAAALEAKSEHPLAQAVVRAASNLGLPLPEALAFQSLPGKGAEAEVEGRRFLMGSARFMQERDALNADAFAPRVAELQHKGQTCIWLAEQLPGEGVRVAAVFSLADTLRPEARGLVNNLHHLGVKKVVMLTGDQRAVAAAIAAEAGLDEFQAELLPADKVEAVRRLKATGCVLMVGDGVNDAPALATANLGVAMGAAGTDVAMETADVVLMGDRLENIPALLETARHAKKVLLQNLTFAGAVIALLLVGALGFALPLPLGVVGHEGSTVLVCLNGLRLLTYRPRSVRQMLQKAQQTSPHQAV